MKQETAIKKMLLEVKLEEDRANKENIPIEERYNRLKFIAERGFNLMWVAGWEEGERNANYPHKKRIKCYNMQGKCIGTYRSILEGAAAVGCERHTISRSLISGKPTLTEHIWKYVDYSKNLL